MSIVLKKLRHLFLVPALTFAGFSISYAQPTSIDICSENTIAKERCEAAKDILRGVLLKGDDSEPKRAPKADRPVVISEDPSTPVIIIPFPTPRPAYKSSSLKPDVAELKTASLTTDPITTQGIFRKCLDVDTIKEPDIRAQRRILKKKQFCISEKRVSENGLNWRIFEIQNKKKKAGPLFVVTHDNENSAFKAGVYGLRKYGGTLVALETGERRFFKGQDPNRNFSTTWAASKKCRLQRAPAPKYTRAILKHRKRGQPIIALHSNANGYSGNGGSGNISIKRKGGGIPFVSAIARSRRLKDEDTLVVLAGKKPPSQDRKLSQKVDYFTKTAGVNVLYEHVTAAKNDCSLSNYVALNKLGTYYNIEVETGDARTQKKVVDIVMRSFKK